MGAGVSNWRLARAVSRLGHLGVVSGTALDQILVRRLQDGDPGGNMRRGLDHFPFREMAERIQREYYIPGGKRESAPYKTLPLHEKTARGSGKSCVSQPTSLRCLLRMMATTIRWASTTWKKLTSAPFLPCTSHACRKGRYVLIGAGIPVKIPDVLDNFVHHQPATYPLHVSGAQRARKRSWRSIPRSSWWEIFRHSSVHGFSQSFPRMYSAAAILREPTAAWKDSSSKGHTAGGHNAPPRGKLQVDGTGEVIYGERDRVKIDKIRQFGGHSGSRAVMVPPKNCVKP